MTDVSGQKMDDAVSAVDRLREESIGGFDIRMDGDVLGPSLHNAAVVAQEILKAAAAGRNWRRVAGLALMDEQDADDWLKFKREEEEARAADGGARA